MGRLSDGCGKKMTRKRGGVEIKLRNETKSHFFLSKKPASGNPANGSICFAKLQPPAQEPPEVYFQEKT